MEEITASMTEMASQTSLNAENAEQANKLSDNARSGADPGCRIDGKNARGHLGYQRIE